MNVIVVAGRVHHHQLPRRLSHVCATWPRRVTLDEHWLDALRCATAEPSAAPALREMGDELSSVATLGTRSAGSRCRLLWERLWLTVAVTFSSLLVTWIIGTSSSIRPHQYSSATISLPPFPRVGFELSHRDGVLWVGFKYFDANVGGLFSQGSRWHPGRGPSSWTCSSISGASDRPRGGSGQHDPHLRNLLDE